MNSKLKINNEDVKFIKKFHQHFEFFFLWQFEDRSRIFLNLDLRCEDLYPDPSQKLLRTVVSRYRKLKIYSLKIVHKDT
jgi:hypothetical protein